MGNVEVAEPKAEASVPARRAVFGGVEQMIAVLLSVAAATMAIIAPFRAVLVASFSKVPSDREQIVNGWGTTPESSLLAVHHGANFGVLLVICAVGVLIAPTLPLVRRGRVRPGVDLGLLALAFTFPAVLTGVIAGLFAYEGGYGDQVEDLAAFRGSGQATVESGACVWLALAAGVCALAAAVFTVRAELARVAGVPAAS